MNEPRLRDAELASLAGALGLVYTPGGEDWKWQARVRLGNDRFEELQAYRRRLADAPETEADFYPFVGADPSLTLAMLEGRLGYYDAVLPRVAAVIEQFPHGWILDLGSYGGLVSLYLGKRFADAEIVGVERCAGAVDRAREFLAATAVPNVTFRQADYNDLTLERPFDIVLSLQTIPTYLLPRVPSDSPETFHRGANMATAVAEPAAPAQAVYRALASLRRLSAESGHVLMHERLPDLARAAFFYFLAGRAGLAVKQREMLTWQSANERAATQQSPLTVAVAAAEGQPFDESGVIDFYLPAGKRPEYAAQQLDRGLVLSGAEAERYFRELGDRRTGICAAGAAGDGHHFHIHLGIADGCRAYVYTCNTSDYREFKICAAGYARMLFTPVVQQLQDRRTTGEIVRLDPEPAALFQRLAQWLGW